VALGCAITTLFCRVVACGPSSRGRFVVAYIAAPLNQSLNRFFTLIASSSHLFVAWFRIEMHSIIVLVVFLVWFVVGFAVVAAISASIHRERKPARRSFL